MMMTPTNAAYHYQQHLNFNSYRYASTINDNVSLFNPYPWSTMNRPPSSQHYHHHVNADNIIDLIEAENARVAQLSAIQKQTSDGGGKSRRNRHTNRLRHTPEQIAEMEAFFEVETVAR
jgi:hypothetical protein